jgi:phosphatidylserine/phosphatidylglycerophosphate/cardiolipin synthase-like enzyme
MDHGQLKNNLTTDLYGWTVRMVHGLWSRAYALLPYIYRVLRRSFCVFLCILWALFFVQQVEKAAETSDVKAIEVVTTIPVETTLDSQGTEKASDNWLEMVTSARKTLDFAEFYLSTKKGEPLEPIIQAIIKAAAQGVQVRFLVGTPLNKEMETNTHEVLNRFKGHSNISVTLFNWKQLTGGNLHAKYFIMDGYEVYIGSHNFDWRSLKHIHETGLRIKSRVFADVLTRIFEADWQYNRGDKEAYKKLKKQLPISFSKENFLVASPESCNPPGVKSAVKTLVHLIDRAQKKISIQLLNYSEDIYNNSEETFPLLSEALTRAAKRGVAVRMVVADWNKGKPGVNALKKSKSTANFCKPRRHAKTREENNTKNA